MSNYNHSNELLQSLSEASDSNILKNIYISATNPTGMFPEITPQAPGAAMPLNAEQGEPAWRQRVNEQFVVRRQSPGAMHSHRNRIKSKTGVTVPVRLPRLPKRGREDGSAPAPSSGGGNKPTVPDNKKPKAAKSDISYELKPAAPEELYRLETRDVEKLPIELFDNDERDRTPDEWVALSESKYNGEGTPAKALFFSNKEWKWTPCKVLAYVEKEDEPLGNFIIEFVGDYGKVIQKEAKRLSLLFDDEDEAQFQARVAQCKEIRNANMAIRRYTSYVLAQSDSLFAPIQQSALHGIVEKLMRNGRQLVMFRQRSVEDLLVEVRNEYNNSMKRAIVDYNRQFPDKAAKVSELNLPDLPPQPRAPPSGLIPMPPAEHHVSKLVQNVQKMHYTRNSGSTSVVLALYKAYTNVKQCSFLKTEGVSFSTLFEYQDVQDAQFETMREKLALEWRALLVNLIRDSLSSTFNVTLFVNNIEEYNNSDLKLFIDMVTFMLRQQLVEMITESFDNFLAAFRVYANPQGALESRAELIEAYRKALAESNNPKLTPDARIEALNKARDTDEKDCLDCASERIELEDARRLLVGYLDKPQLHISADPGRGAAGSFVEPLFQLKMTTANQEVVFQPELANIEQTLMRLLSVPNKLHSLGQIVHEVVPLLGLKEAPLCSITAIPRIFQYSQSVQAEVKKITRDNLRQPLALLALYRDYAEKLAFDPDEYVKAWFPTPEEMAAQRGAQAKIKELAEAAGEEEDEEYNEDAGEYDPDAEVKEDTETAASNQTGSSDELHTLEETVAEISKFLRYSQEIQDLSPTDVVFRFIKVECQLVKEHLGSRAYSTAKKLMQGLADVVRKSNVAMKNDFEKILARLREPSNTVKALAELQDFTRHVTDVRLNQLRSDIKSMLNRMDVLVNFCHDVPEEDVKLTWDLQCYPQEVVDALNDAAIQIQMDNQTFQQKLNEEQDQFTRDLELYSAKIESFRDFGTGSSAQMEQCAVEVETLNEKLKEASELVKSFNERDVLFGGQAAEYTALEILQQKLEPFFKLWSTAAMFNQRHHSWMTDDFTTLNSETITNEVTEWQKLMIRLEKEFDADKAEKAMAVSAEMKDKITEFKKNVDVIEYLRSPGLRQRHWEAISDLLCPGQSLWAVPLTLSQLLSYDCEKYKADLEEISLAASKEYSLEMGLEKMVGEWKTLDMELNPKKSSYILANSEDIILLLDDHILKTQGMRGSPYIKPLDAKCKKWEEKLQSMQRILEEWLNCQKTWIYLEPIFGSEDIMRQMPKEGSRFEKVDKTWKREMDAATRQTNALEFMTENEQLLKKFQECNKQLDLIGKGLNEYLETKRLAFPRFYFLSNDELLSILSQTKNALAVQPHLNKCFDALKSLEFSETQIIEGMYSDEGEFVPFHKTVNPNEGPKKGNVEMWLKETEMVIFECIKLITRKGIGTYAQSKREEWILKNPGQVVLSITQLYFTREVTEALNTGGNKGLAGYLNGTMKEQLAMLINLVRGKLTKLERTTCKALVTIDVHARTVIEKMVQMGVDTSDNFEWLAQLRYYWETIDDSKPGLGLDGMNPVDPEAQPDKDGFIVPDGRLNVRIVNAHQHYGYEYLGNSDRLVITPLTDRCYRTLMGAVHLHLGGAPEGPAGTGKTETVKDLSKALAIQCIVFNCSDGLNYRAMEKMFKGLAASGAWACFDEFNRIELEVLSVVAQQIGTIQRAIIEGKSSFLFAGLTLPLVHTCSPFITMNPGYAGRAELPDNLKALFRTVAMMIPDYALIAEIVLYSFGFESASELSRKVVGSLQLSSEQLSSQFHYDFGMRALFSILSAAGTLKLKNQTASEESVCLRAVRDCNVPKFVSADLPLFAGICQDLFPGVKGIESDRDELITAMTDATKSFGLQPTKPFIGKVLELFDTFCVRHGLMIVGEAFAAKSSNLKILAKAVTSLKGKDGDAPFDDVSPHFLNPKAVTMDQLYGADDPNTKEWKDGVLGVVMRTCINLPVPTWKWVVFDGPVDAIWIENMNTVLDNNKKLCLASGEQIKLANMHTMVFEVEDLSVASPATVSRCGMVFMEPALLGWRAVFKSWLQVLEKDKKWAKLDKKYLENIQDVVNWLIPTSLYFLRRQCHATIPTSEIHQVVSVTRLFACLLHQMVKKEIKGDWSERIECLFVFSMIWSFGCTTNQEGRVKFSLFLLEMLNGKTEGKRYIVEGMEDRKAKTPVPIPLKEGVIPDKLVFDFMYNSERGAWASWFETRAPYKAPLGAPFHEIIVPTLETISASWILDILIKNNHHVLIAGDTGTGKSVIVNQKLLVDLKKSPYLPIMLSFSARTSANQTQDIVDSKLDRRRMGVYGPAVGRKAIVFVDDLNMPQKETYGAQPPIELLRQFMDYSGWYDRVGNTFMRLVDMQFMAAMGPPGGGRNPVTYRFTRHFHSLCITPYSAGSLGTIFNTITANHFADFRGSVSGLQRQLVLATVDLYNSVTTNLLPTPAKSHYTFNLRDVSKVFQGLMKSDSTTMTEAVDMMRMWIHECGRVFRDRLVNKEDMGVFDELVSAQCKQHFSTVAKDIVGQDEHGNLMPLIFANFGDPKNLKKPYVQVEDVVALASTVDGYLVNYNDIEKVKMNLVMFTAAIEHVSRIGRIIDTAFGNALLVGVGGSGRQSLSRLASFISEMDVFSVEITKSYTNVEWREDIKEVMRRAGAKNKKTVFLFTDSQIKYPGFVEDINNLLNNGEVPNLFPPDEKQPICEEVMNDARAVGRSDSPNAVFSFFIDRCKQNLHMVLCFSPVGAAFRDRLRMFPALVNCCTIDWFHPWPTDALKNVATKFLKDTDIDETIKSGVVEVCCDMQERVKKYSIEYYDTMRRYNYVTPTSYLELIKIFTSLFELTREKVNAALVRYTNGLDKLAETEAQVGTMKEELVALQPKLVVASKETNELIEVVEAETVKAEAVKEVVSADEAKANAQAADAAAIKADCEAGLKEAMPALENAMKALSIVKKPQIDELKNTKVPSTGVVLVMEALCIIMGVKPVKKGEAGSKVDDYWEPARKIILSDPKLLQKIEAFDKDNIPPKAILAIRPYTNNPGFQPAVIAKISIAAEGFCRWIIAMEVYDRVSKQIAPKRIALAEAEATLEKAMADLAVKKAELKEVLDKLAGLNKSLNEAQEKKQSLADQVETCEKRLVAAESLIGGLASEKASWGAKKVQLTSDFANVVGNILISSGVIAYLGVFVSSLRSRCVADWVGVLSEKGIKCDQTFKLNSILGDPVEIREWGIQALPNDDFSIDNAIILTRSLRWGLMIDPQQQANRWIKNMEDEKEQLKVVKQTDDNFIRVVTMAVSVGLPVLIEAVGESLEATLEPVLLKNTFKQGSRDMIIIGSETVEFSADFRLYLTTKLSNPHYPPEASTKVTLINFMVTVDGLEDQMLNRTVAAEQPALELERNELVVKNAENQKQKQIIEDKILQSLKDSKGNILDDEELIATLAKSREASKLIEKRVAIAAKTQENIDRTRADYRKLAFFSSIMFFCISDLAVVDPMYQYSLEWFIILYLRAIKDADPAKDINTRTANIQDTFQFSLFNNVCRSLFEKDKLFFAFHMCIRIMQSKQQVEPMELRFLMTGSVGGVGRQIPENPCEDFDFGENTEVDDSLGGKWLPQSIWEEVCNLGQVPAFKGFEDSFASKQKLWRAYYEHADPFSSPLPAPWDKQLNVFQKLAVLRALRADRVVAGVTEVVSQNIGKKYTKPPAFNLQAAFADASSSAPLIFVLSSGVDPTEHVFKMANEMGYTGDRLFSISLGQGQGPVAEAAIREAIDKGTWVLLQNCHLLVSWLPTLQRIVEEIDPATTNPAFRLWLTSMPSPEFPVAVLQNGVKMTNEPPKGIKANVAATFRSLEDQWFDECSKPDRLKKMFYGLSMFHAVCLERRKFGPMGWNIKYQWTAGDMSISKTQLKIYLDMYDDVPSTALNYLFGQLNYGGRVTDEWDTRAISNILTDYINKKIVEPGYKFDLQGKYLVPGDGMKMADYRKFIENLPAEDSSEVFGLHDNVNISAAISDTTAVLATLLSVQPRISGGGAGASREDIVSELARDIESKIPANYDVELAGEKYPVLYENSMNTVLVQELIRFNKLISKVRSTLSDVQRAIKGEMVMSADLEAMTDSMYNGQVPKLWHAVAYPSLKPLSSWVIDLLRRLDMYTNWLENGAPANFWLPGFFFTQSFLTGTLQNYARKYQIAIDQLEYDFEVVPDIQPDVAEGPADGCYIYGLFLDGARFKDGYITEPMKRQLNSIMPTVWLKPMIMKDIPKDRKEYSCPVYKTSERFGVLTTTGKSSNYVIAIKIPSREPEKHWVKRGVALLSQKELA